MLGWGVIFLSVLSVFCGCHKYMVPYVKEVISTLQNINLRSKRSLKIKKFSSSLAPASGSEGVTKIKWKEREMSFHPHFVMEGPHLCVIEDMDKYFEKKLVLLLLLFIKLRSHIFLVTRISRIYCRISTIYFPWKHLMLKV